MSGVFFYVLLLVWIAAIWDVIKRRIPNLITFSGALGGLVFQAVTFGVDGMMNAMAGLAIGFAILLPSYIIGTTGAGDVKLLAAIGAFIGPYDILFAALIIIMTGSVVAMGYAASALFSQASDSPWSRYGLMFKTLMTTGRPIYIAPVEGEVMGRKFPFAVSIAIGTTLFLVWQMSRTGLTG